MDREELTMAVIISKTNGRKALTKVAGRGSNEQVEAFDRMMVLVIILSDGC